MQEQQTTKTGPITIHEAIRQVKLRVREEGIPATRAADQVLEKCEVIGRRGFPIESRTGLMAAVLEKAPSLRQRKRHARRWKKRPENSGAGSPRKTKVAPKGKPARNSGILAHAQAIIGLDMPEEMRIKLLRMLLEAQ